MEVLGAGSHLYLTVQGVKVRGSRRSEPVRMLCENMTGQVKEDTDSYKPYQHFCVQDQKAPESRIRNGQAALTQKLLLSSRKYDPG